MSSLSKQAWKLFDDAVKGATGDPWKNRGAERIYVPDIDRLERLLGIPVRIGAKSTSGLPAKAVDVWMAYELRRAGFDKDEVWPRAEQPRVLPREIALMLDSLPKAMADPIRARLAAGTNVRGVSADGSVLGKAYYKQVDVIVSQWARGPEILVSTKRMDSSVSNNAFNRIEESYGDAHNLRGRYPLAAIGYVLVLKSTVMNESRSATERLIDLVGKLSADPMGYDATAVVVAEWDDAAPDQGVKVMTDAVPERQRLDRFMRTIVEAVLERTPIDTHVRPRELRAGIHLAVREDESR